VVGGIGGLIGTATAVPLVGYFISPIWRKSKPIGSPIARTTEIPVGEPKFVTYEQRLRDGWYINTFSKGAWVVNKGNEMAVYDPRCTHLNCPYYWDKEKGIFQCPCHDGRYDIDGNVLHGPPPRPLDKLEFYLDADNIVVTGRIIRGEPGSREGWLTI
jgi:Rieske Fe-S protein